MFIFSSELLIAYGVKAGHNLSLCALVELGQILLVKLMAPFSMPNIVLRHIITL